MESNKPKEETHEEIPTQTLFSQQRLDAWRPLFTPPIVVAITSLLGIFFLIFGICFHVRSSKLIQIDIRYDDICEGISECVIYFNITKEIKGTMFLHYKLTNFFQNHGRYINSRSDPQLRGEFESYNDLASCGDFRSVNNSKNLSDIYVPCGAVALSLFNDTFEWLGKKSTDQFTQAGISWRSDREKLFKPVNEKYNESVQWLVKNDSLVWEANTRNESFIVWMRSATLPTFMKIAQKCISNCTLSPDSYPLLIHNRYPTSAFNGEKHLVLSTVNEMGGKNKGLGLSYIISGAIFIVYSIVVLISHLCFPRKLGDASYFMGDF